MIPFRLISRVSFNPIKSVPYLNFAQILRGISEIIFPSFSLSLIGAVFQIFISVLSSFKIESLNINPVTFLFNCCSSSFNVISTGIEIKETLFLKTTGLSFEGAGFMASIFFAVPHEMVRSKVKSKAKITRNVFIGNLIFDVKVKF